MAQPRRTAEYARQMQGGRILRPGTFQSLTNSGPPHRAKVVQPKAVPHAATLVPARPPHAARQAMPAGAGTAQRMEAIVNYFSPGINPLERGRYTSCVCLVVTEKDEAHIDQAVDLTGIGLIDRFVARGIFTGMSQKWAQLGGGRPFEFCCINGQMNQAGSGFSQLLNRMTSPANTLVLGAWPLFIVVGHTAPGGKRIEVVEHKTWYECDVVARAITQLATLAGSKCLTIFASSCSSGVPGSGGPSFQENLDAEVAIYWPTLFFSIGTTSGSAPLPFIGKVHAKDFTFRHNESGASWALKNAEAEQAEYDGVDLR